MEPTPDTRFVETTDYRGKTKQVTRDQFVKLWRTHTMQLYAIMPADQLQPILDAVVIAAQTEWDRMYGKQSLKVG